MNPTKLIRSIFAKRLSQIDRYADYGDIIQQKTLLDLLQKAKNTEFGTKFKFNDISSISKKSRKKNSISSPDSSNGDKNTKSI